MFNLFNRVVNLLRGYTIESIKREVILGLFEIRKKQTLRSIKRKVKGN